LKNDVIGAFSESGWINETLMMIVIDQIAKKTNNEKSVLVIDKYDAHKTKKISDYANTKNITMIYVPAGMTYKYQPLDVSINGILKVKMKKSYSVFMIENKDAIYTHSNCINDLLINLKSIGKKAIINSFLCLERSKRDIAEQN
jgi:hypothetical protein